MSKHTPGPWYSTVTMSSDLHFIRSIDSDVVGQIAKVRIGPVLEQDEALANARLIATSPELLEHLKKVLWEVEAFEKRTGIPQFSLWITEAKALIAKAQGG